MDQAARQILFRGHVQGVGFRFTTHRIAGQYNLTGFVRNLSSGDVEMLAQGPQQDIENCLADIQDSFSGYIRDTQVEQAPFNPRHTAFRITF